MICVYFEDKVSALKSTDRNISNSHSNSFYQIQFQALFSQCSENEPHWRWFIKVFEVKTRKSLLNCICYLRGMFLADAFFSGIEILYSIDAQV